MPKLPSGVNGSSAVGEADPAERHVGDEQRERAEQDRRAERVLGFALVAAGARAVVPSVEVGGRGRSSGAKGSVSRPVASATSKPSVPSASRGPCARRVAAKSSAPASTSGRKLVS